MSNALPSPEAATELIGRTIPFVERMGLRIDALDQGYVRMSAPLPGNENHVGTMYAGALFTLAEIPGGVLILSVADPASFYPILTDMTVRYCRPANGDVSVEASLGPDDAQRLLATAKQEGKAEYVLELEVKDSQGAVVMTSKAHYQLRSRNRD